MSSEVKPFDIAVQFGAGKATRAFTRMKLHNIQKTLRSLHPKDRIEDVIFLRVFIKDLRQKYERWLKERMPGGPDSLMNDKLKKALFDNLFQGAMAVPNQDELLSIFSAKKERGITQ